MDAKIGKFEILASYTYVKQVNAGALVEDAKQYGFAVAVCGARGGGRKGGYPGKKSNDDIVKAASAKKKKTGSITSEDFDKKVTFGIGDQYNGFIEAMEKFVKRGLSYDDVKATVNIPATRGAKITVGQFISASS